MDAPREYVESEASVGRALEQGQAFTTQHPLYKALAVAMEKRLAEVASQRAETRAAGQPSVVTLALMSEELASLSQEYPEFGLVNYGNSRVAHAYWVQSRRLAGQWLLTQAAKVADVVSAAGVPWICALMSGLADCHMLIDLTNVVAVQERHAYQMDVWRLFSNYAAVGRDVGAVLDHKKYEACMARRAFRSVAATEETPKADALCVDGALYAYGPMQVAAMMQQSGSKVAFGFFVYHSVMLLEDEGEIPGTGVSYVKSSTHVSLRYPEGVAGVVSYPRDVWEAWLTSHVFYVGKGAGRAWFQVELLKNRGPFMFYRMVALPTEPAHFRVSHALEVDGGLDRYVVMSWELASLGANPANASSWRPKKFVVSKRLMDRVYQHAMQLPREQFTRYAVRKQLHVVNDRVTVEGTSVRVNSPLGARMVDAMVVAVYARAFVDRYEAGTLTKEAMELVKQVAGFGSMSFLQRVWTLVRFCVLVAWDYTLGAVNALVRDAFDWFRDCFSSTSKLGAPVVEGLPPYVLLKDATTVWWKRASVGADAVAAELSRRSSLDAKGLSYVWARVMAAYTEPAMDLATSVYRVSEMQLFGAKQGSGPEVDAVVGKMRELNPVDEAPAIRYELAVTAVTRAVEAGVRVDYEADPDPVFTLNEFYASAVPGVAPQNLEYDTASISLDPQDRTLAAPYLRLPSYFGEAPKPKELYHSRLRALNVPKRQGTMQELLSSIAARNLNAPQVSLPQDEQGMVHQVWETFLREACVPGARDLLARYASDPVSLEETAFREWTAQSTPAKLAAVRRELEEQSRALAEMPVDEYLVMLKADVKPTLSTKPIETRTEPQVIVYHEKALSAFYSSIFRVLVRRFLALLKPNYHVNLLKDTRDMSSFLNSVHPFGVSGLKYLENDFSKYDKSQGRFVFLLEAFVFAQLGMNDEMLQRWLGGHVQCSLRSLALGLSLHVMYQRKSGDATTSFGNVVLNILSVTYAYHGTKVIWAVFMGDDSLICAHVVGQADLAPQVLAEVFNLGAKTYLTSSPYFASHFVIIDDVNERVSMVPDPVKRVERWSMAVSADDPQWHERYISAVDSMGVYLDCINLVGLEQRVSERYDVSPSAVRGVGDAIATLLSEEKKFRALWEERPEVSVY